MLLPARAIVPICAASLAVSGVLIARRALHASSPHMVMGAAVGPTVKLNTGLTIPSVGLGVFLSTPGKESFDAVTSALRLGYRHIDTARYYQNEADVGKAVRMSGMPREEIFITTKIWISDFGYKQTQQAITESLELMGLPSIDLMLLHAPGEPSTRAEAWRALEEAHKEGKLANIGVSNFGIEHLEKLQKTATVVPAVNQVELTPFLQRRELVEYCRSKGIALQAYSPLGKASRDILHNKTVSGVAKRHGVTNAQVLIRWSLQKGFIPLPKSSKPERQKENLDVFEFELDAEDMGTLDGLERELVTAWDPVSQHPV